MEKMAAEREEGSLQVTRRADEIQEIQVSCRHITKTANRKGQNLPPITGALNCAKEH